MSARKLAVVLCVVMAGAAEAIAQVVQTEPTVSAAAAFAAESDVIAAALNEQTKLSNPSSNTFGMGAAVAIEGDTAVVGAPFLALNGIQRGKVFVYTRTSGSWQLQQILERGSGVGFGASVDISGDTLIVGTAHILFPRDAVVFVRTGGTWTEQATLTPEPSATAAVAIDGNTALVGSLDAVHVYERAGSAWTQQAVLVPPDRGAGEATFDFGDSGPRSVALEGDTAIIGAVRARVGANAEQGAVYVFTRSGAAWSAQAKLARSAGTAFAMLGSNVALSGNTVLASDGRGAFGFERSGTTWMEQSSLAIPDSPKACSVCPSIRTNAGGLAIDGDRAVVLGSPGLGGTVPWAAYSFKRVGTSWFLHEQLIASDADLGTGVAIEGSTVLAGAPSYGSGWTDDTYRVGPGAAYIFTLSDTLPNQQPGAPTLTASASGNIVNLSWTPAPGPSAVSFIVEAGTATGLLNVFNGNVGSVMQLSAPAPPATYYVRVRGVNEFGPGPASIERVVSIGGAPAAPTVTSAVESGGILNVAWLTGAGSSPTSHRLDFYTGSTVVASVAAGAATTVAIPVPAGTHGTYGVRVTAFSGATASPASALFAFTIGAPCTPPASPSLSGAVAGDTASVNWTPVAGATSYVLSAGTTQGGTQYMPPTEMATSTGATASGLPPSFTAWVRVLAVNACGQQSAPADLLVH